MKLRKTCYIFGQIGVAKKRKYIWPFLPDVLFDPLYRHPFQHVSLFPAQSIIPSNGCSDKAIVDSGRCLSKALSVVFLENIESSVYFFHISKFVTQICSYNPLLKSDFHIVKSVLYNIKLLLHRLYANSSLLFFSQAQPSQYPPPPPGAEAKLQSQIHYPF